MTYVDCRPLCQPTCQNPNPSSNLCLRKHTDECVGACICSNGTVFDSIINDCVQLERCSCSYKEKPYHSNDRISIDCNQW